MAPLPIADLRFIGAPVTNTPLTFALTSRSIPLDPRTHAFRPGLADVLLADRLFEAHFAAHNQRSCRQTHTQIHVSPGGDQSSELLQNEGFAVLDIAGGWAWGWSMHDHYVGYVRADALSHFTGIDKPNAVVPSPIEAAKRFLGMTYVWGGRGGTGIDCSGLVQRSFASIGCEAPRDSDMQRNHFGTHIDVAAKQAGDLIFFPGHVGILVEDEMLIHATRHYGKVVEEPLGNVVDRITDKHGQGIVAVKRPSITL